jgi:hypothetical protein
MSLLLKMAGTVRRRYQENDAAQPFIPSFRKIFKKFSRPGA